LKVTFKDKDGGSFDFEGSQLEFETLMDHFEEIKKSVHLGDKGELKKEP